MSQAGAEKMMETSSQIENLAYNAAEARFEALVTFHTDGGRLRVASSYEAPLDADPQEVERGIMADAMGPRDAPGRLQSRLKPSASEPDNVRFFPKTPLGGALEWLRRLNGRAA
jgi:hypothetical protein